MPLRRLALLLIALVLGAGALATLPVSPASAGVDPTPPAEGSCHWLTWDQVLAKSAPAETVDCSEHNTRTVKIVQLTDPNWSKIGRLAGIASRQCWPAMIKFFGGRTKALQMSAYSFYWWIPSKAQRDAGAEWLRCDLAVRAMRKVPKLAADETPLSLPLGDGTARCRTGKRQGYVMVRCADGHAFRATHALKYPRRRYPGADRMARWTVRACRNKLPRSAFYYETPSRQYWKIGLKYSICLKATRN